MAKTEAHQLYRLADGTLVPGATSITSLIYDYGKAKGLMGYAYNCGRDHLDMEAVTKEAQAIGHLVHQLIYDYYKPFMHPELTFVPTDTSDYSKNQIDAAENSYLSFLAWAKRHKVEPVLIEEELKSERYRFGGTLDLLAIIDGRLTLVDFKSGKDVYLENWCQLAAYNILITENYPEVGPIELFMLVRIGKGEDEDFSEPWIGPGLKLSLYESIFLHALGIYQDLKEMKGDRRATKKAEKAKAKEIKLAGKSKGGKRGKRSVDEAGAVGGVDERQGGGDEARGGEGVPGDSQKVPD